MHFENNIAPWVSQANLRTLPYVPSLGTYSTCKPYVLVCPSVQNESNPQSKSDDKVEKLCDQPFVKIKKIQLYRRFVLINDGTLVHSARPNSTSDMNPL